MENVGPLNGANKLKSGQEFVTNLFDSEGSEEEQEENEEGEEEDAEDEEEVAREREEDGNDDERAALEVAITKNSKKEKSTAFKEDSQKILLNLSKPTLRKIVMLICDEAVIDFSPCFGFVAIHCYLLVCFFEGFLARAKAGQLVATVGEERTIDGETRLDIQVAGHRDRERRASTGAVFRQSSTIQGVAQVVEKQRRRRQQQIRR